MSQRTGLKSFVLGAWGPGVPGLDLQGLLAACARKAGKLRRDKGRDPGKEGPANVFILVPDPSHPV